MERATVEQAKSLFGGNFIGVEELQPFFINLGLDLQYREIPDIPYSLEDLKLKCSEYVLILGLSKVGEEFISIEMVRRGFGVNPHIFEPCFYNQDWYINELFMKKTLGDRWYLIRKDVIEESRAVQPDALLKQHIHFPSVILCAYTFFAYYFANNEFLWYHDFIWCDDVDHNGDRIYVGKYHDIDGVNKNGFSIHRHLTIRDFYGCVEVF